jgi:hypothetical protein
MENLFPREVCTIITKRNNHGMHLVGCHDNMHRNRRIEQGKELPAVVFLFIVSRASSFFAPEHP